MLHENMSHVTDIVEYYIPNVRPEFYDFHFGNSLVTNLLKTFQLCFLARVLGIELPVYFFSSSYSIPLDFFIPYSTDWKLTQTSSFNMLHTDLFILLR